MPFLNGMKSIPQEQLRRVIGVKSLTLNAVNLTVGAGIFALPATVAGHLGANAVWAYGVCGLLLGLVLLCFAEVGTKVTTSGGAYAYVEAAFGPLAGFVVNTLFWLGFSILADAAVANVLIDNLAVVFPVFKHSAVRIAFFAAMFAGIATINIRGAKESAYFISTVTIIKLLPLLALILVGAFAVQADQVLASQPPTILQLGEGALILFFAFGGGAEATLSATGEITNPQRTIPRALLLAVLFVMVIYVSIQVVAQGVLGDALALNKEAPLAEVAQIVFGEHGKLLLLSAAILSCFAMLLGDIFVTSRLPYAAARDGLLPKVLALVHPVFKTPHYAIALYAFIGFVFSVSGGFKQLAVLSSASILIIYVGVIAATIKLRKVKPANAFIIPGGLTIPLLALASTGWFLSNLSLREILAAIIFIAAVTLLYFLRKWMKEKPDTHNHPVDKGL